jgi:hypothetical protein
MALYLTFLQYEGTDIGLALARRLLKFMNGTITVILFCCFLLFVFVLFFIFVSRKKLIFIYLKMQSSSVSEERCTFLFTITTTPALFAPISLFGLCLNWFNSTTIIYIVEAYKLSSEIISSLFLFHHFFLPLFTLLF